MADDERDFSHFYHCAMYSDHTNLVKTLFQKCNSSVQPTTVKENEGVCIYPKPSLTRLGYKGVFGEIQNENIGCELHKYIGLF